MRHNEQLTPLRGHKSRKNDVIPDLRGNLLVTDPKSG